MQQISPVQAVEQKPARAFHLGGCALIRHRVGDAEPLVRSLFVNEPSVALCGFTLRIGREFGEVVRSAALLDDTCAVCRRTLPLFRRLNPDARVMAFMVRG